MKNFFLLTAASLLLLTATSCKKETNSRNYGALQTYSQTAHLPQVTAAQLQMLYDTATAERDMFLARFQLDHPGLKAQMDNDANAIIFAQDSATRIQLLDAFIQTYHAKVLDSWNLSGINATGLTNKYRAVLGNIPFNLGEFGTVTIVDSTITGATPPVFTDDSFNDFQGCPVTWQTDGCGGLGSNTYTNSFLNSIAQMAAGVAGGCDITLNSGADIDLPNRVYQYITGTFSFGFSTLDCMAFAAIGGACSSASLSAIIEADGSVLTTREVYAIHAVSPVIWYANAHVEVPFGTRALVAAHNDSGLPTGNYKAYLQSKNNIASGALVAISQSRSFIIRTTALRMTR